MMILVTGTSGALGGLILDRLAADRSLDLVAGTRTPSARADGTSVREIDFDRPGTLATGFNGVDVLVFVSAGYAEDDVVLARHGAVIDAAAEAGVRHVIYTSLAGSGDHLTIAVAHRWTERRLAEAPFASTILRNGLYAEIPAGLALAGAPSAAAAGVFAAPWGQGTMPVVARADLADVAATVAAQVWSALVAGRPSVHAGRSYELEGAAVGGADLAAALTEALGTTVRYHPASLADTRAALSDAGLPPYQVAHSLSMFSTVTAGLLTPPRTDLPDLLEGPPRPVHELIVETVRTAR